MRDPGRGVFGWAVIIQAIWTRLDEFISLGRALSRLMVRMGGRRAAIYAQTAEILGCTSPSSVLLPQPSGVPAGLPAPRGNRRAEYDQEALRRDRCTHEKVGKPYHSQGTQWMKCLLCDRRWRAVRDEKVFRWVVDDADDPDRRPVSRASPGSAGSSSPSAPSSAQATAKGRGNQSRTPHPQAATPAAVAMNADTESDDEWYHP